MAKPVVLSYQLMQNNQGQSLLRPLCPLTLNYLGNTVSTSGLLDTGADVNVLPYSLGLSLGAVWDEQTTSVKLSGNLANYDARGILIDVVFADFSPVKLAFAWTQASQVPMILGQVNFFMEFDVCFYRSKEQFAIYPK
jgi:hypothetical protein